MFTGNVELDLPEPLLFVVQIIQGMSAIDVADVAGVVVVVLPHAKGQQLDSFDSLHSAAAVGIIPVVDDRLGRHRSKAVVGIQNMVHRFKIFHMVGIDIEDHRNVRMEFQEMVLKFAGFADHHLAVAQSAAAADCLELAADDRRRVHPALDKHLGKHCCGSGFAVCAADPYTVAEPAGHQSQQLRPLDGGHTAGSGCHQLRVVIHDCCGVDNQVRTLDVLLALSDGDRNVHLLSLKIDGVPRIVVRTGDVVPHPVQNLHQRKHSRAADADEMDVLFIL